ncbi:HtaA domain-containing protein [Streptomyces sp. AK02-01A]|uniref:HtaA domain-containing protein n=1 Tax=Streptomyces sp. AK02-01A TaxID=3028648 RepID=UPI0029A25FF6|nr:HtaA domain-containing protein [Streptomyces sp. AK02-01A]MDX3849568.1 HtaA domain-containing protein [Streptomyces sp. AK02-01A]MDX3849862.1 HtaA domain-containing protein [Streptomyces sp. AK02-01A]
MPSFRPLRAFAVALLMALPVALLPAAGAQAADRTVQGGRLDWGIKSSFQSYVTGPIAHGSWSLTGGAATVGGSQFRFHSATGTYDPGTGAFRAGFSGGVRFLGHRKTDGTYELDLTISRPTVRISGGGGTLYADMTSKAKGSGRVTTASQVPLAALDLSGITMAGGGSPVALANVPAKLTSTGATAFAGYYTAGTPLDPVSLSVDVAAKKPVQKPTSDGAKKDTKTEPRAAGAFQDAAVDWGVRRTYREYVTGSIAQGRWALSGGAQDGGALFRFPRGKGSYDAAKRTLDAGFAGSVRFTGTGLDLTLSQVTVRVRDGRGTLSADVADAAAGRAAMKAVPLVTFAAKDLTPKNGLASVNEAPATLTSEGAKAFGSLYSAGTAMDPVSLAVAVDRTARLPALPDLGSEATASARPEPSAATSRTAGPATEDAAASASSAPSVGTGTYAAIGAGLLVVAGLGVLVVRRRRGAAGPGGH